MRCTQRYILGVDKRCKGVLTVAEEPTEPPQITDRVHKVALDDYVIYGQSLGMWGCWFGFFFILILSVTWSGQTGGQSQPPTTRPGCVCTQGGSLRRQVGPGTGRSSIISTSWGCGGHVQQVVSGDQ